MQRLSKQGATMDVLPLPNITLNDLKRIANIVEKSVADWEWTNTDDIALGSHEQSRLSDIAERLQYMGTTLMNEATLWARVIYPLLVLAEHGDIRAWSQVPLQAQYTQIELQGFSDGVLGSGISSMTGKRFHLVVIEAKRGLESTDPRFQLCGQLLAAARLNWEYNGQATQELYGCYTVIDIWTFIRTIVTGMDTDMPTMTLEFSREFDQMIESETILKILKRIVTQYRC